MRSPNLKNTDYCILDGIQKLSVFDESGQTMHLENAHNSHSRRPSGILIYRIPEALVRGYFEYKRIALGFAILCAENSEKARGIFMHPKVPNTQGLFDLGKV